MSRENYSYIKLIVSVVISLLLTLVTIPIEVIDEVLRSNDTIRVILFIIVVSLFILQISIVAYFLFSNKE